MTLDELAFEGHTCVRLEGARSVVIVSVSAGPRILGLFGDGENLLAVLPEAGLDRPDGRRFRFLGGHRLWVAPEDPDVTYQPDEHPCAVSEVDGGVRVEAPPDGSGLIKSIEVRGNEHGWIVDHSLTNASSASLRLAPWAITQLRPGGEVTIPNDAKESGPNADRSLVLWPYTDLADPRIGFAPGVVRIDARSGGAPLKLGVAPSLGSVRYSLMGQTFEKRMTIEPEAEYPERGAAVQVYLCDTFCELETLGPLRIVEPDAAATHRERWALSDSA